MLRLAAIAENPSQRRMGQKRGIKQFSLGLVAALALSACAAPKPSVPAQPGKTISEAKQATRLCAPNGPQGATNAVVGNYIFSVVWGGILLGPIVVASTEDQIRQNGARRAIDKCLEEQGYTRRELTAEEGAFLNALSGYQRQIFLDHLVGGGSLEEFKVKYDVQENRR